MFFNLGLVLSLLLCITAFEWRFYDTGQLVDLGNVDDEFDDLIDVPITDQPPPPPPVIQQPVVVEVPDEEVIEKEMEMDFDVEFAEDMAIEDLVFEDLPEPEVADQVFTVVEEQPEPYGGIGAFYEYVKKTFKYPNQARRMNVEGKVYVQFVVDKDGTITEVQAIKGIGAGCDEEAVRVLENAPKWKPGKQRGVPVKVRIVLPINFKLG